MNKPRALITIVIVSSICVGILATFNTAGVMLITPAAQAAFAAKLQAQAREAAANAERAWNTVAFEQSIAPDLSRATTIGAYSLAGALTIILIGGAIALAILMVRRVTMIYPTASGQWPVFIIPWWKKLIIHDPNRQLGPTAMYALDGPTVAQFPLPADPGTMARIASGAAATSMMVAIAHTDTTTKREARGMAERFAQENFAAPLPPITQSHWEPSHVERLLADPDIAG